MKNNKRYLFTALATQMIAIPIVFTIIAMVFITKLGWLLDFSQKGKYTTDFIFLLWFSLGIFIIGTIIGMIFSKKWSKRNIELKYKYKVSLLPICYAMIFAIVALLFSKGNYNSSWWAVYIFKNPAFLVIGLFFYLMGNYFMVPVIELMSYVGFIFGVFVYELISKKETKLENGKNFKIASSFIAIALIVVLVIFTKDVVSNAIIEISYGESTLKTELDDKDLFRIAPFQGSNKLAKLESPASLQFTDINTMPRLDGATAAYPVYASFAESVYKGLNDYYRKIEANDIEEFKDKNTSLAFVNNKEFPLNIIKCSKTGEAYERLIKKETDIIFVAEPSKEHMEKVKASGDEFVLTPIGSEAFVFFTNKRNPVESLTVKQIQDIYAGSIKNWKEVGGENKSILPFQRPENSGSQTVMQNKVMKGITMIAPNKENVAHGMGGIISQVASYKNAKNSIGYSFMYYSSEMFKNNQIKYVAIDGIQPTPETVINRTYPFTVPVYAVTLKSNKNENVEELMQWILSAEGQKLVEETGYVPVSKK